MKKFFLTNSFTNTTLKIIKIFLSILFIGCLFDMSYGYYQLVRFLGMVGFGILAFNTKKVNQIWFLIWFSSAILINPIFKIAIGRVLWNTIDIIWSILLIVSIFFGKRMKLEL
ncbi:DUF6804 family protein [Aquimarina agarivorans]|uniref:DUF6804 family protein n=1 Tax=Aquimarina agarivorans TaxID=980584 RepID=UPI000248E682|nr:DUF6804 family protein [Aquimarina agarivorans]